MKMIRVSLLILVPDSVDTDDKAERYAEERIRTSHNTGVESAKVIEPGEKERWMMPLEAVIQSE